MARRKLFLLVPMLAWLAGCGQAHPPLAGGKPFDYWFRSATASDAHKRAEAMDKLGNIGDADARVYPTLIGATTDPDPRVRCQAVLALVKLPDRTGRSRTLLADIKRQDGNARVRQYAAKALARLSVP